jgi:hypothetical protein
MIFSPRFLPNLRGLAPRPYYGETQVNTTNLDREVFARLTFDVKQTKNNLEREQYLLLCAEEAVLRAKEAVKKARRAHQAAVKAYDNF